MKATQTNSNRDDLPAGLAQPARRALVSAGYTRLDQLASATEAEISRLHGVGPNAISVLRRALQEKGISFKGQQPGKSG